MPGEGLLFEKQGTIACLTINRPQAANSINKATNELLVRAWEEIRADEDIRVVVLTGAGDRVFCSGADLKEIQSGAVWHEWEIFGGITRALPLTKPIIAAINGHCVAGGLELSLCCDLRVAAGHATFALPEVKSGLVPGAGGTQRLPRMIPYAVASEMILLGKALTADEAHRLGLINAVVAKEDVVPVAMGWAAAIADTSPDAIRSAVWAMHHSLSGVQDGLMLEQAVVQLNSLARSHAEVATPAG